VTEPLDLQYLSWHWAGAYPIPLARRGQYEARRRDDGTELCGGDAEELLEAIRADYSRRPVPRENP